MPKWVKHGLQGWTSASFTYLILGNIILSMVGQEGFGISFRLVAANFILGFFPALISAHFIKKGWAAYFGGAIIPMIIILFLVSLG